jgi:protein-arginine kinase activator protein McsA
MNGIEPTIAISNIKGLEVVKTDEDLSQNFSLLTRGKVKKLKRMTKVEKQIITQELKRSLDEAIKNREFEKAATIRDQLKALEQD